MRILSLCGACENGEHRRCPDVAWRPGGGLRQCSCQGQCLTTIELGRRGERALFRENTRGMNTLANLLWARDFAKREDVQFWERKHAHAPAPPIPPAGPNPHTWPCDDPHCTRCDEAVQRLLRDCGVLPKGKPDRARVTAEPVLQRLRVPMRYREDRSDK